MSHTNTDRETGGCPVIPTDYRPNRPALHTFEELNQARELGAVVWNESCQGFWMVNRYEEVKEALRMDEVFTNSKVNAFDPDMQVRLLPQTLNGEDHVKMRAVLNPWFSPGAVKRLDPISRSRCAELIEQVKGNGQCDLVADFGIRYPTDVFLTAVGLPVEDGPAFVDWVEAIFGGFHGHDQDAAGDASAAVQEYFDLAVADREKQPRHPGEDFITYLLQARIDGQPIPREDVITVCSTIMLAGLDTTRSAIGYVWYHLATHESDRQRILTDPAVLPRAIEEFLRLYSLLIQDGRYVAQDIDFHGAPMKAGDMVSFSLIAANRDPRKFEQPDEFYVDRGVNPHIAFGLGPHRCLGMHLARRELHLAIEEWHSRIPDYRLAAGAELVERGGQLSLLALPLEWDVATRP
jgi:cytochrome P450